jgi:putative phosphoribosyl transferase
MTKRNILKLPFEDRAQAGRLLGEALAEYAKRSDVVVLALPRGGVPVGFEVARMIDAPLDIILVRKLGTPGQEELAMGAIASGGVCVLNPDIVAIIDISQEAIEAVAATARQELERRERAYRGNKPPLTVENHCLILVDDGLATGASMLAAVSALRQRKPASIVVAIPVAPSDTVQRLKQEADDVVCLATPEPFSAVGRWYREFSQTSDDEVKSLLKRANSMSTTPLNATKSHD